LVDAVRVQQNGAFFSVANLVENGGADYLERLGLDRNGALYKMYNSSTPLPSTTIGVNTGAEKKTPQKRRHADLVALYNGVTRVARRRSTMFTTTSTCLRPSPCSRHVAGQRRGLLPQELLLVP